MLMTHPASSRKPDEQIGQDGKSIKYPMDFPMFMGILYDFDTLITTNKLSEHDVFNFSQDLLENDSNIVCDFVTELLEFTKCRPLQARLYLILFNVLKFWAEKDETKDAAYLLFQKRYSALCKKLLEYYSENIAESYDLKMFKSFLNKNYVVKDAGLFLINLQKEAVKTMESIQSLHRQIELVIGNFNFLKETVLFHEVLSIKGFSNLMGRCVIKEMKIIVRPYHNNCLDENIFCSINIFLELIIERDHDADTSLIFEDPAKLGWSQLLSSLKMEEREGDNNKKFGIISAGTNSYYNQITISEFPEFKKLRKSIKKGTEKICV